MTVCFSGDVQLFLGYGASLNRSSPHISVVGSRKGYDITQAASFLDTIAFFESCRAVSTFRSRTMCLPVTKNSIGETTSS